MSKSLKKFGQWFDDLLYYNPVAFWAFEKAVWLLLLVGLSVTIYGAYSLAVMLASVY